ncbi:MAG: NAD-glutamate dehydrogenase [Chlamydiia bacterium]|nr:NAD-glutamate dehydrogenase [Chlamydiia bacterium]
MPKYPPLSSAELKKDALLAAEEFERLYQWLSKHMPASFFDTADHNTQRLIAHSLSHFSLQEHFFKLQLPQAAIVCCMDGENADTAILGLYPHSLICGYRAFISNAPPPGKKEGRLRISLLDFHRVSVEDARISDVKEDDAIRSLVGLAPQFFHSMTNAQHRRALKLAIQAKEKDQCQYELIKQGSSLQIMLAWKDAPKAGVLHRLAKVAKSHHLDIEKTLSVYIELPNAGNVLLISLDLHCSQEILDQDDFLRELLLAKSFDTNDLIDATFIQSGKLSGNAAHLIRNLVSFSHQTLVHADPNLYSFEHIVEGFCHHPDLTILICKAFEAKFHPTHHNLSLFTKQKEEILQRIEALDTGQAGNDLRRKQILRQGVQCIDFTLKTNFYRINKTSFSFRIDPLYLDQLPYDRKEKFPELPFGIFFIRGALFIGFNVRFKDLARGGVRTVLPNKREQFFQERDAIFTEAYNLALTQQKKNKDIPEGGAKTAILLEPTDVFFDEEQIDRNRLEEAGLTPDACEERLATYRQEQRQTYINDSQKSFIESFMTLIDCEEDGSLRDKAIVDYWKKPEYIYLGPDENISNEMLLWIARYAERTGYRPGLSFMSSKPGFGINHKQYGVTSFGVNVYLEETLRFLGIDPKKDAFTIKISGGPDGDVAGNELLILHKLYPRTAKLVALTDVSGTIYDPNGLDLDVMADLVRKSLPIRYYPAPKLSNKAFLLDLGTKRGSAPDTQQTLLWRKQGAENVQQWLSSNETHLLYRNNIHQTIADVFVPAGGRPRTLNETNYTTYLTPSGAPTSKAIVEGANLYLTPGARKKLESLGCLILKDSSCNKGGVITSSFEVLAGLCMTQEEFLKNKEEYVKEVLEIIRQAAEREARLLLNTHKTTGADLTDVSEKISERINRFKYELLDHLSPLSLSHDPQNFLIRCLIQYCPPILRKPHLKKILAMPDLHKKAIIACYIASRLVYGRGLDWIPSVEDVLPTLENDQHLFSH